MRTLLYAIPAFLALAGTASAEPQQLDEAQLGGVAAGQDSISMTSGVTNFSTSSISNSAVEEIGQSLSGGSSNTVYSTGVGSAGVNASGMAGVTVTGTISGP